MDCWGPISLCPKEICLTSLSLHGFCNDGLIFYLSYLQSILPREPCSSQPLAMQWVVYDITEQNIWKIFFK